MALQHVWVENEGAEMQNQCAYFVIGQMWETANMTMLVQTLNLHYSDLEMCHLHRNGKEEEW
jgi:hypothetical protein